MTEASSDRTLAAVLRCDLGQKLVVLTGARQAGKTTHARQLMAGLEPADTSTGMCRPITLHTIRDKERNEIDFVLAEGDTVTDLVEVKLRDPTPSAYLQRMAERLASARAVQIVAELRQPAQHGCVEVASADRWLAGLAA